MLQRRASKIVVLVLNTHQMIITIFHIPAPGMGSLLIDSFGKEVGKRKWRETFAGPLARRLSRSGRLSFIFSKEKLIFSCFFGAFFVFFFGAFPALPSTKKTQFIAQKAQLIAQFKAQKKHISWHQKKHNP